MVVNSDGYAADFFYGEYLIVLCSGKSEYWFIEIPIMGFQK